MMIVCDTVKVNEQLEKQKKQHLSVKDKDPQYRVEYRFPRGSRHYCYFVNPEDALEFDYYYISYFGCYPSLKSPLSKQLQKKGPRGGWSKYKSQH